MIELWKEKLQCMQKKAVELKAIETANVYFFDWIMVFSKLIA